MSPADERPEDDEAIRFHAIASGQAQIFQAGGDQHVAERDLHLHYADGVRRARRLQRGGETRECPYPGLVAFESAQADWFFGRDTETAELLVHLDEGLRGGGPLIVVAPSGAGKSSLLRAGVLPAIARGALPAAGSAQWPHMLFTPTASPMAALSAHLASATGIAPDLLGQALQSGPSACLTLLRKCLRTTAGSNGPPNKRLVVVVDQLEELFTLGSSEQDRHDFLDFLSALASIGSAGEEPIGLVVYGMRSDFYTPCADYPQLRGVLQDRQVLIGPMTRDGLRHAITIPAQATGLDIEPGLVELLLRDLGVRDGENHPSSGEDASAAHAYEAGRLPLLAHALRATWQQRHGHTLTVAGYQATGGIYRAVGTTAERVYNRLDSDAKQTANLLFMSLVKVGDGVNDTRKRLPRTQLLEIGSKSAVIDPIIEAFTEARLLTVQGNSVEITHEALLGAWPRLQRWIKADRAGHIIRQELEEVATSWSRSHQDAGMLYRGHRLETVRTWAKAHRDRLSTAATEFLAASSAQERRTIRLRRVLIAMLTTLALIASGAAVVAFQQRATAQAQRDIAVSRQITVEADRLRDGQPSLAALFDIAAYRWRPQDSGVYTRLITNASATLSTPLAPSTGGQTWSAVFSPHGRTLATIGTDHKVRLWNVSSPVRSTLLGPALTGNKGVLWWLAFSPNGRVVAGAGSDGRVWLWKVTDPAHPVSMGRNLTLKITGSNSMAFSPDGRMLATAESDGSVRLWDVADPVHPTSLASVSSGNKPGFPSISDITSVTFSPDGRVLAAAEGDSNGVVQLWDLADPAKPTPLGKPLSGSMSRVEEMKFSPNGRLFAIASNDGVVRIWNTANVTKPKQLKKRLSEPVIGSHALAFSPDGRLLATATFDGTVRIFSMGDPSAPEALTNPLTGHKGIWWMVFSPDGHTLASAGSDGAVLLWKLPKRVISSFSGVVSSLDFSPDGHTLATVGTGSGDELTLWNVTDPAHPISRGSLTYSDRIKLVAFSPDRRTLATGGEDLIVRLWNVADPSRPSKLADLRIGHTGSINSLAFSPDGRTLATAGFREVQLWNVADPTHAAPLGKPLSGHTGSVNSLAFSPDGRTLATAGDDGAVRLWNVADPTHAAPLGKPLSGHAVSLNNLVVNSLTFSPDGHTLATAGADLSVRLWNVADPSRPSKLADLRSGHTGRINSLAFSPDGRTLATAGADLTIRLWNMAKRVPFGPPVTGHASLVTSVRFSPDGHTLASAGLDGTVRLWETDIGQAVAYICNTVQGGLTQRDWQRQFPDIPFRAPCP
ncbi:translocation protein TolB [Streptomyces cyanogenus]|uniref:Translocation protein TolB n=1 Tax=Streptomyces cyanogenus TaxID=80860 RepID=A0ABX7TYN3_STRCY|nr:translocation protein TolB [Streptomyces cyanogenus]